MSVIYTSTTSVTYTYSYTRNSTSSGTDGVNLAKGSCAWTDRALNSSEPALIELTAYQADAGTLAIKDIVSACSRDPNCVTQLCASNQGGYFTVQEYVVTSYPF